MFAQWCLTAWNVAMTRPNCSRTLAYSAAISVAPRATPTASADSSSRARSRPISARAFGGKGVPSGVRRAGSSFVARCRFGLNPRMPSRARQPFIRLMIRVRSATRLSRSRCGRLLSSSSIVGIAAMLQCSRSPRSHPRNARFSSSVSSRSVFARRCWRGTAMLVG